MELTEDQNRVLKYLDSTQKWCSAISIRNALRMRERVVMDSLSYLLDNGFVERRILENEYPLGTGTIIFRTAEYRSKSVEVNLSAMRFA